METPQKDAKKVDLAQLQTRREEIFYKNHEFRLSVRRNRLFGAWAGGILGYRGEVLHLYIHEVVMSDLEEPGDQDILRKVKEDFRKAGKEVPGEDVSKMLDFFGKQAVKELGETPYS